jgi:hypothetical protein
LAQQPLCLGKLQASTPTWPKLQRTADAITAMRAGGAPAFYAEHVRGASPQMLLSTSRGRSIIWPRGSVASIRGDGVVRNSRFLAMRLHRG